MSESETVPFTPKGLAQTIASREVGANRVDPSLIGVIEKLKYESTVTKLAKEKSRLNTAYPPLSKDHHSDRVETGPEILRKMGAEIGKELAQAAGGHTQGEFEAAIKNATTPGEKDDVANQHEENFNPKDLGKAAYLYTDEHGEKQYLPPIETVKQIAAVENRLFDSIRLEMENAGQIAPGTKVLTPEQTQSILREVDKRVTDVGMTLLRGMAFPSNLGGEELFIRPAYEKARNILNIKGADDKGVEGEKRDAKENLPERTVISHGNEPLTNVVINPENSGNVLAEIAHRIDTLGYGRYYPVLIPGYRETDPESFTSTEKHFRREGSVSRNEAIALEFVVREITGLSEATEGVDRILPDLKAKLDIDNAQLFECGCGMRDFLRRMIRVANQREGVFTDQPIPEFAAALIKDGNILGPAVVDVAVDNVRADLPSLLTAYPRNSKVNTQVIETSALGGAKLAQRLYLEALTRASQIPILTIKKEGLLQSRV